VKYKFPKLSFPQAAVIATVFPKHMQRLRAFEENMKRVKDLSSTAERANAALREFGLAMRKIKMDRVIKRTGRTTNRVTKGQIYKMIGDRITDDKGREMYPSVIPGYWEVMKDHNLDHTTERALVSVTDYDGTTKTATLVGKK